MRRNLLSFCIGLIFIGTVFTAHAELSRAGVFGSAMAAGWNSGRHISGTERRQLLRTITYNNDSLLRISGNQVRTVLQQPELIRTDLPTVVWQYRNGECVLDVYFASADADASSAPVVHYEVRSRLMGSTEDEALKKSCIKDLLAERNQRRAIDIRAIYKS